jgi:hypothetical protein
VQPILDHIATVVRPALRRYQAAEAALTNALTSNDAKAAETAREETMLAARQAVYELHHLSDFVFKEPSPSLAFAKIGGVRNAVEARCVFLRTAQPAADVTLLRDVANAFKHHRLGRGALLSASQATSFRSASVGVRPSGEKGSGVAPSRSSS